MSKPIGKSVRVRAGCLLACLFAGFLLYPLLDTEAPYRARIVVCMSNIKQLSQNFNLYAQDWNEGLPPAADWLDVTEKYREDTRLLLRCPDYPHIAPGLGYAYNSNLSVRKRNTIANPAVAPLLYDSNLPQTNANAPGRSGLADPPRHNHDTHNMNAIGFLDGHVARIRRDGSKL